MISAHAPARFPFKAFVAAAFAAVTSFVLASCNNGSQAPPAPLSITSGPPPNGTVGVAYEVAPHVSFPLTAAGGSGGYQWSWAPLSGSKLPPGLRLDLFVLTPPGQGVQADIGGVPTTAGAYHVVVTVNDGESPPQHASATYAIAIAP